ncbi:membrane associated rhomboid family serine protease [Sphingomonas kyeonggiensis]|uniref:Membrane associated rhomboid family serine protease n=1 Tax=Sphingomonas kyeonggiensis TaxID=1268553 RepID=A0A7W7K1H2_9SPHN|nr:rhomboid family intramembrane serine protease [Sphingomonas kyeonggiensis]MBB4838962.1 membrane associated rhomboid family serine protease [Sphingomonas kyeonggiensis]
MKFRDFPATILISAITALVGAVILITGNLQEAAVLGGFIPARAGAELFTPGTPAVPAILTPLTTLFIHVSALQIFFNVLILVITGQKTEQVIGWPQFLLLYVIGAFASAGVYYLLTPDALWPLLGMNGAVSAVLGAYALLYGQPRTAAVGPFSARTVHVAWLAAAWAVISILTGLLQPTPQGVSLFESLAWSAAAPIGGFLAGLAAARPLFMWHWRKA